MRRLAPTVFSAFGRGLDWLACWYYHFGLVGGGRPSDSDSERRLLALIDIDTPQRPLVP
jgi:hypothetical protein